MRQNLLQKILLSSVVVLQVPAAVQFMRKNLAVRQTISFQRFCLRMLKLWSVWHQTVTAVVFIAKIRI